MRDKIHKIILEYMSDGEEFTPTDKMLLEINKRICALIDADCISRQDAIDVLNGGAELLRRVLDDADIVGAEREKCEWGLELIESYVSDMKELPSADASSTQDRCKIDASSDLISRQDVLDYIDTMPSELTSDGRRMVRRIMLTKYIADTLPSAKPEINRINLVRAITSGIIASNGNDIYSCGMRNGMRWCKSLLSDKEPKYEDASQYAEPERKTGKWLVDEDGNTECPFCGNTCGFGNYCNECGADLRGEDNV